MTAPVLFLDDASSHAGQVDRARAEQSVKTLISTLRSVRKVNPKVSLNIAVPLVQFAVAENWTLQSVLVGNAYREEWDFIRLLLDRSPFSTGLEGLLDEVARVDFSTRSGRVKSVALAWAKLLDTATVSLDAHVDWSLAWVETTYGKLDNDGEINELLGRVRNASRAAHVDEHAEWLRRLGLSDVPAAHQIWEDRAHRFPGLRFLPRVQKDLEAMENSGIPYLQALSALEALAKDVADWKVGNPWPTFSTKASGEHEKRRKLCWVEDKVTGKSELFDWHTRFTGGIAGRVHFRVDVPSHSIVIAYVGGKVLTAIQPSAQVGD